MKASLVILLLFITTFGLKAQSGEIRGTVWGENRSPLLDAKVSVKIWKGDAYETRVTLTGKDGSYALVSLNPGSYTITFSANRYHDKIAKNVLVTVDKPTLLDVQLIK